MTGSTLRYDEDRLVAELSLLPLAARVTFAASCAERMLPVYRWFHERTGLGDPTVLEAALGQLWDDLSGGSAKGLGVQRDAAEGLVPREDDCWAIESAFAQNAAAAVTYAISCRLTGDPQDAGWAARQIYEALDYWISWRYDIDWSDADDEKRACAEERIMTHPLMQAELHRQNRDLELLRGTVDGDVHAIAERMRYAARAEGDTVLNS